MPTPELLSPEPSCCLSSPSGVPGDGVRDFFFRVASLTFEAIVLSELETSGSKHVSDIVSESLSQSFTIYPIASVSDQFTSFPE